MKILELFSGYGTASFALKRLVEQRIIDSYECVGYSDIDKYANQCFKQNHFYTKSTGPGTIGMYVPNELGNVKEVDPNKLEDFDLLTGGFPCQAFSVAGKGLGELDPRGTLFWEIVRIAEVKKPRYMLLENVKGLVSKKHKPTFDKILSELERIGYHVHWKVLNTKEYGIPQNRERVWFVCFKDKSEYDSFTWPEKEELKIFIKDILEPEPVNSKFYLKEHQVNKLLEALAKKNNNFQSRRFQKNIASTLAARDYKDPKIVDIQSVQWDSTCKGHHSQPGRDYNIEGVAPCLQAQGTSEKAKIFASRSYPRTGSREQDGERFQNPEFREDGCSNTLTAVEKDNLVSIPDNTIYEMRGRSDELRIYPEGINPTVSAAYGTGGGNVPLVSQTLTTAIGRQGSSSEFMGSCESVLKSTGIFRRLTPKECFRLQGFLNDEINFNYTEYTNIYKVNGNIKLWKQQSAKSNAAKEKPTHTNMVITALCTTKDLNELELGKNKEEILRKIESVCIAIEKLEKVDAKECVINITKCSDYTEMLYTLIKRKIGLREMDMFVELEEGQDTKSLWKISLGENLSKEKSFITSILINWIIQKKIYSYVKTESTIIANIMNYNLSEQNCLNLELSSLRMDTTKKLSDTALYKLAGNGQSVNVVEKIFKEMFK